MSDFLNIFIPLLSISAFGFSGSLHCLGMCSPMIATCQKKTWQYFAARSISYTVIGLISGIFGSLFFKSFLNISAKKLSIVIAIVAVIQVIFLIKKETNKQGIFLKRIVNNIMRYSPLSHSASLGIITALLPCGFLYAAILMCASFANPLLGALGMLLFSIVTSPVLIGGKGLFIFLSSKNSNLAKYISISLLLSVAGLALMRGGIFRDIFYNKESHAESHTHKIECH